MEKESTGEGDRKWTKTKEIKKREVELWERGEGTDSGPGLLMIQYDVRGRVLHNVSLTTVTFYFNSIHSKIAKRVLKDEKEVSRLTALVTSTKQAIENVKNYGSFLEVEDVAYPESMQRQAEMDIDAAGGSAEDSAAPTEEERGHRAAEIEARELQLVASNTSLMEAIDRLSRSKEEEDSCTKRGHLEELRAVETTEWMIAMQGVLWPENTADSELGRPVIPEQPPASLRRGCVEGSQNGIVPMVGDEDQQPEQEAEGDRRSIERAPTQGPSHFSFYAPVPSLSSSRVSSSPSSPSSSFFSSRSKDLLSYGMCNALDAARMLRIQEVVDVDTTLEAFRWMSWCYRCLHVLRIPPATYTLKRLLACCKPFKLADEKVVKAVSGILSRSMAWKSKVRKLLLPAVRPSLVNPSMSVSASIESARLHALVAEGGMVPMTSCLKEHLVRMWDGLLVNATAAPPPPIHVPPLDATLSLKPKRGSKAHAVPAVPGIAKHVIVTMAHDAAESSEEEENGEDEEEAVRETERERETSSIAPDRFLQDDLSHLSSSSSQLDSSSSSVKKKKRLPDGEGRKDCVYTTLSPSMWAPLPDLWPPSIAVRQVSRHASASGTISCHTTSMNNGDSSTSNATNPTATPFTSAIISSSNSS